MINKQSFYFYLLDKMEQFGNKYVVNLSQHLLTNDQKSVLSFGLNFCPTPNQIDPGELRTDLDQLHRKLRLISRFKGEEIDICDLNTDEENNHASVPFAHRNFRKPSCYNPAGPPCLEAMIISNEMDLNYREKIPLRSRNISPGERLAIRELKDNNKIVIKPADKGSAVVILNREDYLAEGYRQLSDIQFYQKVDIDLTEQHRKEVQEFISELYTAGEIDISVSRYLTDKECRTSRLYLLPKIHKGKNPPPGRPIVSANGCPTERISQLVDHFLTPPTTTLIKSYVRDTTDFIKKLNAIGEIPPSCVLVTMDVTSLYTNIPNDEGLRAAMKLLTEYRPNHDVRPSNLNLVKLLEMVLKKNNFQFNGDHYLQIGGTAMGTKAAPGLANCFMGNFEEEHVYKYKLQPLIYLRFLDDCFMVWQHGEHELNELVIYLNNCLPSIKFTIEKSENSVNFLDTTVKILDKCIITDLYSKPTDAHNYLLYKSAHPRKCKDSIPYSQFLRIRRICTRTEDYDKHVIELCQHFNRRGYPTPLLEKAMIAARRIPRENLLQEKPVKIKTEPEDIIMVTRYHPDHDTLREIVEKNWDFLGKTSTTQHIHEKKLMVGYRRPKNLRDLIVRADVRIKLPKQAIPTTTKQPRATLLSFPEILSLAKNKQSTITSFFKNKIAGEEALHGSTSQTIVMKTIDTKPLRSLSSTEIATSNLIRNKCIAKKQCRYCPKLDTSGNITCSVTKEVFESKTNLTCRSSNLIYCITCYKCKKQYVGQTKRTIMARFQGHFEKIKSAQKGKQIIAPYTTQETYDPIGQHFSKPNHDANDIRISVLAFITLKPDSEEALKMRLKVEKKWIHLMRCPAPSGLNIFD